MLLSADVCVCVLTGEALTQSSLLEADGDNMAASVEPMNLHHAMLRSPGGCLPGVDVGDPVRISVSIFKELLKNAPNTNSTLCVQMC